MKKLWLMFALLTGLTTAEAGQVNERKAREKAETFMSKQLKTRSVRTLQRAYLPLETKSAKWSVTDAPFYAYNCDGGGFVIVSGDDRTVDILGFSETGHLNTDRLPLNMRDLLQGYVRQIENIPAGFRSAGTRATTRAKSDVAPALKTAWGQDYPYNLHTPGLHVEWEKMDTTVNAATGCVATAMAQMMYHYKYPAATLQECKGKKGVADVPVRSGAKRDTVQVEWNSETVAAGSTIDWTNIVDKYSQLPKNNSDAEREAVARLMQYAGASVGMKYGVESAARTDSMLIAMVDVFGYNDAYMANGDYYELSDWIELVYQELVQNGPLLFGAETSDESYGHQFIIDGYKQQNGNDYFYTNWGWDGEDDGYYLLNVMVPESEWMGIGIGFSLNQVLTGGFGAEGKGKALIEKRLTLSRFSLGMEGKTYKRQKKSDWFEIPEYDIAFYNMNFRRITADFAIAIYDSKNKAVDHTYFTSESDPLLDIDLYSGFLVSPSVTNNTPLPIAEGVGDGTYTVKFVETQENDDDWYPMHNSNELAVTFTVKGNELTFSSTPSAISPVVKELPTTTDADWYSLSGTRLDTKPQTKGIYIHNGKKIVVK